MKGKQMDKIRFGVVGLGHRGRHMARLAAESFKNVELVAACDIDPLLWNETQWLQDKPLKDRFPQVKFYEDYSEMLEKNQLDLVLVETGADVHAGDRKSFLRHGRTENHLAINKTRSTAS